MEIFLILDVPSAWNCLFLALRTSRSVEFAYSLRHRQCDVRVMNINQQRNVVDFLNRTTYDSEWNVYLQFDLIRNGKLNIP